jgi:hypothetical protein
MSVLTQATRQWESRPKDERFSSLAALHDAVTHYRDISREARGVNMKHLSVEGDGEPLVRSSVTGQAARFTHYSFGQFARQLGAPANYLRTLPAPLVAANLNTGIQQMSADDARDKVLLLAQNGGLVLRAALTKSYTRIWNNDVTSRLIRLTQQSPEWQPAPAAFDGSRGLYASDKDIFCFLVDNDRRIFEKGPAGGLGRGFFVSNSEVGDASFRVTTFLYEYVCGNHRVWGATGIRDLRIPHIGNADDRAFRNMTVELRKYAESSGAEEELKIERAMRFELGATKDEVLDKVFGLGVTRKVGAAAYALAEQHADNYGNPRSAWGFTGGLTEIARDLPYADERTDLDRKAGKILQIAF